MVKNLLAGDVPVGVFDLAPAAVERAVALGAVAADPAQLAAEREIVFLCLPAGDEVRATLFGAGGVAARARRGLLIVDHSTYNRNEAVAVAERAAATGLRYADCPISGMPFRALDGTLTMMFGGDDADYAAARPYLEHTGEFIVHCGPVGSGQLMKAFNNVIYDINIAALCELLPLALKAGLDAETLARVVTSGSSRSFASEYFVPRMLAGEFAEDFPMNAAYKDIVNVQETAVRLAAMTPVTGAMTAVYQQALAHGLGGEPKSAMIKLYEQALGVRFRHRPDAGDPQRQP